MGVRYYAYPLAPEFVARAMDGPRPFLSDDPLADAWGLGRPKRSDMLYLDKCWRQLQSLTRPPGDLPRPSHALVAGDVTYTQGGWLPWIDVLTPSDVDDVTRDLALLDVNDVDARFAPVGDQTDEGRDEREYVTHYLRKAQEFTGHMQQRGWGLIYLIG